MPINVSGHSSYKDEDESLEGTELPTGTSSNSGAESPSESQETASGGSSEVISLPGFDASSIVDEDDDDEEYVDDNDDEYIDEDEDDVEYIDDEDIADDDNDSEEDDVDDSEDEEDDEGGFGLSDESEDAGDDFDEGLEETALTSYAGDDNDDDTDNEDVEEEEEDGSEFDPDGGFAAPLKKGGAKPKNGDSDPDSDDDDDEENSGSSKFSQLGKGVAGKSKSVGSKILNFLVKRFLSLKKIPVIGKLVGNVEGNKNILSALAVIVPLVVIIALFMWLRSIMGPDLKDPSISSPDGGHIAMTEVTIDKDKNVVTAKVVNDGELLESNVKPSATLYGSTKNPVTWLKPKEVGTCSAKPLTVEAEDTKNVVMSCDTLDKAKVAQGHLSK